MAPEIDRSSFVLGELTGKLDQMERTLGDLVTKINKIDKSMTHLKVKTATQAGSVAVIISLVVAFVTKALKWH